MDLGRRMHAYSLPSAWLLCSNAMFYWETFEKGCEQWYYFLLYGVAEAVHFSNLPRPPASGCWPFFSTFAYRRSLPELISFWECLAKSCEKQPVPAPRAAGFLGREASKYSDLKTASLFFSLVNSPEVSGLSLKGFFYLVFPLSTRAMFLKLPLFQDWIFFIASVPKTNTFGL